MLPKEGTQIRALRDSAETLRELSDNQYVRELAHELDALRLKIAKDAGRCPDCGMHGFCVCYAGRCSLLARTR